MKVVCFDTETTWFFSKDTPIWKQPFIIQWWQICFDTNACNDESDFFWKVDKLFRPNCTIPKACTEVHGITDAMVKDADLFFWFFEDVVIPTFDNADLIVAHNTRFDMNMLYIEAVRTGDKRVVDKVLSYKPKTFCTMKTTWPVVRIPKPYWFKHPKLQELHKHCFWHEFEDAHNAFADVEATWKCFVHLLKQWVFKEVDNQIQVFT